MKAKLIFDLEDPDDTRAHLRAVKSLDMASVLFDLCHRHYKELCEIADNADNENEAAYIEAGVKMFHKRLLDSLDEHGIVLDDLIR